MSYKRSKYFSTSGKRKIKYLFIKKNSGITVVFFHGFMSYMLGDKPIAIEKFCRKQKIKLVDSRHPVVEKLILDQNEFIGNDIFFNNKNLLIFHQSKKNSLPYGHDV